MNPAIRRALLSGVVTVVAVGVGYLSTSGGLFWVAPGWQIGLFCGAVAGLVSTSVVQAGLVSATTTAALALVYAPWYASWWDRVATPVETLTIALAAAVAACVVAAARFHSGLSAARVGKAVSVALLLIVVLNTWITLMTIDYLPTEQSGTGLAADLAVIPQPMSYSSDAQAYLRMHHLMQGGMGYYDAVRDAWAGKVGAESLPWGVVSYRLPTLFWLWSALPSGGTALIPAFLLFATLAIIGAFMVPFELGLPRLAPVAAALVAGNYMSTGIALFITYVDPWAMALTLCGLALLIAAVQRDSGRLMWAAVAFMVAAALVREILIYVPVLVGASLAVGAGRERLRMIAPWLVGIGAFALAYVAHVLAVGGQVAQTDVARVWSQGSLAALVAAVDLAQAFMSGKPWFMWVAVALGVAGAAGLWRAVDRRLAVAALAMTTVPLVSLLFIGNPGTAADASLVSYWGMLCIPINLALAPAAILLMRSAPAATAVPASGVAGRAAKTASKRSNRSR